jgi:PleD family two-component response regulator
VKQQRPELADTPILFVSTNRDPARKARLLEHGASDTIEKPFHPAELLARLGVHLRLRQLRNELREKNLQLERLSVTDPLTSLRNRRFADGSCRQLDAHRHGNELGAARGLDHLRVTTRTATPRRKRCATSGCSSEQVQDDARAGAARPRRARAGAGRSLALERQREAIATPSCASDAARLTTISIGVATASPADGSPEDLVAAADRALYEAKGVGRNRVAVTRR